MNVVSLRIYIVRCEPKGMTTNTVFYGTELEMIPTGHTKIIKIDEVVVKVDKDTLLEYMLSLGNEETARLLYNKREYATHKAVLISKIDNLPMEV